MSSVLKFIHVSNRVPLTEKILSHIHEWENVCVMRREITGPLPSSSGLNIMHPVSLVFICQGKLKGIFNCWVSSSCDSHSGVTVGCQSNNSEFHVFRETQNGSQQILQEESRVRLLRSPDSTSNTCRVTGGNCYMASWYSWPGSETHFLVGLKWLPAATHSFQVKFQL